MKKIKIILALLLLFTTCIHAQETKMVSTRQNYVRGITNSKYSDTTMVIITYNLEEKKVDFNYVVKKAPICDDAKSISLNLTFVDKESNAPGIYAETIDKTINSVIFYDGWIEVHYRNGDSTVFNNLKPFEKSKTTK